MQTLCESVFSALPELFSERLRLRPLTMADTTDIYRYASDPAVSKHVLWDTHESPRDSRAYLRAVMRQYRKGAPSTFAIERRSDHRVIGTFSFVWVNIEDKSAEVGYSIAHDCWGQGYASEALLTALHFGFQTLRLNRIEAEYEISNPASGRVMEKCGMTMEGIMRQRVYIKGHYADVGIYAILRSDPLPLRPLNSKPVKE